MMMSFILFSNGYVILPSAFHAEKRYRVFYSPKNRNLQNVQNHRGYSQKEKRQRS